MKYWYKLITYLFYPLAHLYLLLRLFKKKESSERYKEKLSKISVERGEGFLIWFHVASVGEAMSILPLIENCIDENCIWRPVPLRSSLPSAFRDACSKSSSPMLGFRNLRYIPRHVPPNNIPDNGRRTGGDKDGSRRNSIPPLQDAPSFCLHG